MMKDQTRVLRVFGLRRSGNHVFINWLFSQQRGEVSFYNNVDLDTLDGRVPDKVNLGLGDETIKIYSFEDRNLDVAARRKWIKQTPQLLDFIVVRSTENLFASRIKAGMIRPTYFSGMSIPELAHQYLSYAINPESYERKFRVVLIPVIYDEFVRSEDYRRQIAERASFEYTSIDLSVVDTKYGRGSSFAPGSKSAPSPQAVTNRWRALESHPLFRKWMSQFLRLSARISAQDLASIFQPSHNTPIRPCPHSWALLRGVHRMYFVNFISILRCSRFVTWVRTVAGIRRGKRKFKRLPHSKALTGRERSWRSRA